MNNFGKKIRAGREQKKLLLREVAFKLEIDTALLSKIERGQRKCKKEQIKTLANILDLNKKELHTLWLADQVYEILEDEKDGLDALKVAEKEIKYKKESN